jgi:hypothetical protein
VRARALSNIEPRLVCGACGKRGAAGRRLFCYAVVIERITMTKAARVAPPLIPVSTTY